MAGDRVERRTVRAKPSEWAEIDRRAASVGMERSDYMVACARASVEAGNREGTAEGLSGAERRALYDLVQAMARRHEDQLAPVSIPIPQVGGDGFGGRGRPEKMELRDVIVGIHRMVGALHGR